MTILSEGCGSIELEIDRNAGRTTTYTGCWQNAGTDDETEPVSSRCFS